MDIQKVKQKSSRNKTITLNDSEKSNYLNRCITISNPCYHDLTNKVIQGNAFEIMDHLPNNFVDLLIVDPPYNLSKKYSNTNFKRMNDNEYREFTEKWMISVKRTLKDNASIYVCCDWKSSLIIGSILQKHFYIQNRITWQREKGRGAKQNWKNSMEDIWFATVSSKNFTFNIEDVKMRRKVIAPYKVDGKPKDWIESKDGNFRDTCPSNFWDDISVPYWSMPENTEHPTQKPEKLIAKLILASSKPDDIVFDPFLGSGTTAVVAKKLKRKFLGIETEDEYCALAQRRIEIADSELEIQGYSGGVFWERNSLALQQKLRNQLQQTS